MRPTATVFAGVLLLVLGGCTASTAVSSAPAETVGPASTPESSAVRREIFSNNRFIVPSGEQRTGDAYLDVAYELYLRGQYADALRRYREFILIHPDAPRWERELVHAEVVRISGDIDAGRTPRGPSLADRHYGGHLAVERADQALAVDRFAAASVELERAHLLLGNPVMLLEAGLASGKAGEWGRSADLLGRYIARVDDELTVSERNGIVWEIGRLRALDRGDHSVEDRGLADCIYAARGERQVSQQWQLQSRTVLAMATCDSHSRSFQF